MHIVINGNPRSVSITTTDRQWGALRSAVDAIETATRASPVQRWTCCRWSTGVASPPRGSKLIDSLLRFGPPTDWEVRIEFAGIDGDAIEDELDALSLQLASANSASQRQQQITPTISATTSNGPETYRARLLTAALDRLSKGRSTGCVSGRIVVQGNDPQTVDVLCGVVLGTVSSDTELLTPLSFGDRDLPASMWTVLEASRVASLPTTDAPGFRVRHVAQFDCVPEILVGVTNRSLVLGWTPDGTPVEHPLDALTGHTVLVGTTGSGKTSAAAGILQQLDSTVGILVIEAAKQEWEGLLPGCVVWNVGTPDAILHRWFLNPLEPHDGTPVLLHAELVLSLIASVFALFAPLPNLLERSLLGLYESRGWDLTTSRHRNYPNGTPDPNIALWPTVGEWIEATLSLIDEMGYSGELEGNLKAATQARLGTLLVGAKGLAFNTDIPFDTMRLLKGRVVVNLDALGSDALSLTSARLAKLSGEDPAKLNERVDWTDSTSFANKYGDGVLGVYTPGNQRIEVADRDDVLDTLLHEGLHLLRDDRARSEIPAPLEEALTEHYTRAISPNGPGSFPVERQVRGDGTVVYRLPEVSEATSLGTQAIADRGAAPYVREADLMGRLEQVAGKDRLWALFRHGDHRPIRNLVDAKLGSGTWARFVDATDRDDWNGAEQMHDLLSQTINY
jgi:hypothetical protein